MYPIPMEQIGGITMLKTEQRNPNTMHIDQCSTQEILELIQIENMNAAKAVGEAIPQITLACDAIEKQMRIGGRLIYIGAGSSGRLGVLDAAECPPTYGVSPETVMGIMAGGNECMFRASENAEDGAEAGIRDLQERNVTADDVIVGISAAGNAAYVAEAIRYAKALGCVTVGITSNCGSQLDELADISIVTDTGPEAVTGSTRMKAGTAQKMVTNMLSTCVMIRLGMVYENMMINLKPSNEKLKRRVISIVCEILHCGEAEAIAALQANDWNIRRAVESR
ncbi:MAG: N-acetylmuramic acid 6-phosphate etherase [Ruminococcaceae bacterium]|nr:N-acetylmuramic acid 6-phosphate etherase [Oscillospiraceae bacterium]